MAGRHLKPINRQGRSAGRRALKSLPTLSCEVPGFDYVPAPAKTIDATAVKTEKDKAAA
jgi:hypothetical protein